jgi:hypothetical protein
MSADTMLFDSCQFIGADQDPWRNWPIKMCGCKTLNKKAYCGEHYWQVYNKGTAVAGKRKAKEIDAEIAELERQRDIQELENE